MFTTFFLNSICEDIFKHQEFTTIPQVFYIGLSTTAPNIDGTGVTEPELNTGYKRIAIQNDGNSFGDIENEGYVCNIIDICFPESKSSWGTVSHCVIFDEETGGNLLMCAEFSKTSDIPLKSCACISAGSLQVSATNGA